MPTNDRIGLSNIQIAIIEGLDGCEHKTGRLGQLSVTRVKVSPMNSMFR